MSPKHFEPSEFIQKAVAFSTELNTVWASSGITAKENLQKLIFPEGIYYDGKNGAFRTGKINLFSLYLQQSQVLELLRKLILGLAFRLTQFKLLLDAILMNGSDIMADCFLFEACRWSLNIFVLCYWSPGFIG